mmetsp:Transcript_16700/g.34040  ORF Transcript_16700/g.34040 Transcript_16700/m.34040 type:complete len:257 (+) Transcript_16700:141-911(+)|eukprot:CAMPEP_0171595936 /NCGR_PEP_ID=MMETSP0990-20121206/1632_1 /TAXON_ID=483369 /ORGANISM="non described non described, Strain CCMP2098" /LENGTH=256 /DNA_ID=CAMNT_0012157013 /DNA_START=131 /DNA_END=901 /DNA_ORIENTATION=+
MASIVKGVESILFGEQHRRGGRPVNLVDEDMPVIYEGPLQLYTGLAWYTSHWKLIWRDELKTQAMLLRFKHHDDKQPQPGKASCILIGSIRTLVPVEEHETKVLQISRKGKQPSPHHHSSSSASSVTARRVRSRFALETIDGSAFLFASESLQERVDWMGELYSILIRQAHSGQHQDPSIIEKIRACEQENEKQRSLGRDIDLAMQAGSASYKSNTVLLDLWNDGDDSLRGSADAGPGADTQKEGTANIPDFADFS